MKQARERETARERPRAPALAPAARAHPSLPSRSGQGRHWSWRRPAGRPFLHRWRRQRLAGRRRVFRRHRCAQRLLLVSATSARRSACHGRHPRRSATRRSHRPLSRATLRLFSRRGASHLYTRRARRCWRFARPRFPAAAAAPSTEGDINAIHTPYGRVSTSNTRAHVVGRDRAAGFSWRNGTKLGIAACTRGEA